MQAPEGRPKGRLQGKLSAKAMKEALGERLEKSLGGEPWKKFLGEAFRENLERNLW